MTTRLSISSFAGMARTLVAVGTVRLASMLVAIALAGPRSTLTLFSSISAFRSEAGSCAGMGLAADFSSREVSAFFAGSLATGGLPLCCVLAGLSPDAFGAAASAFTTGSSFVGG